jgi:hypothetical protein
VALRKIDALRDSLAAASETPEAIAQSEPIDDGGCLELVNVTHTYFQRVISVHPRQTDTTSALGPYKTSEQ